MSMIKKQFYNNPDTNEFVRSCNPDPVKRKSNGGKTSSQTSEITSKSNFFRRENNGELCKPNSKL